MKFLFGILLLFPLAAGAQLPIPITPDWLKQSQSSLGVLNSTQVTLTENNYRIVQTNVIGRSRGFKLLGLITIKPASHTRAMSRLYSKAHVEEGRPQALANLMHESGSSNFILFSLPKVTIRADLIEFTTSAGGTNNAATVRVRERVNQR
jgi:hypothetical protein